MDLTRLTLDRFKPISLKAKIGQGVPALRQKLKLICKDNPVTEELFINVLPSKNPEFPRKFFRLVTKNKTTIEQERLVKKIVKLAKSEDAIKLKCLFEIYDFNDDGTLSFDEVGCLLRACMAENGLQFTEDEIDQLTATFMEEADQDNSQTIDFVEFRSLLNRYEALVECMCRSFERWMLLSPAEFTTKSTKKVSLWQIEYIRNNALSVITLTIYVLFSAGLFFWRIAYFTVQKSNPFITIARGAGMLLNFNCALIMLFILRRSITRLRILGFASYLPLDKNIKYHKFCGYIITFFALLHTFAHLGNYALISAETGQPYVRMIFSAHPEYFTFFFGAANITGWVCLGSLFILVLSSLPFVRKSGHFEIFAYFHLFYIVFWSVLLLHGPKFWIWLTVPGICFIIEKVHYFSSMMGDSGNSYIVRCRILPSKVSHLAIRRPKHFDYHPGDWVYIQIPKISSWEWHPFTISSAPEMPDVIFLHIRSVGEWTNRLHSLLLEQEEAGLSSIKKPSVNVKCPDLAVSIPPTPKSIASQSSMSSNEITETPFMIRRGKVRSPTNREQLSSYRQVIQDLTDRLGSIVSANASTSFQVIQFTRPIGRCCDDDDEARFYAFKDNDRIDALEVTSMITGEKVVLSSTPKPINSSKSSSVKSMKSISSQGSSFKNLPGTLIRTPLELPVRLDGPYGSPSSHIFKTEHAVMIATGIGVTPFASILQSIMFRYAKSKHTCPQCKHSWSDAVPTDIMRLKKVDFIWLNRDQKSLEWFVHLLTQLEMTQAEIDSKNRFLDIHIFITSALDAADIRALGLQLALGLMHEKKERDLITGLRTKTKPGRPNWNQLFDTINVSKKGKVTTFYCGAPVLGKQLHNLCNQYGFNFHKEIFS
ncbi:NADPH oxidase 5-like isoform X2 [Panonychus citri]|uniref:NADPH oxidase 5-like isoform X2 n=1 Tax=Panonychus citri TaxID=50023 RepID=UPI002307B580|nr:NADPH oxidase 5-like isoform X2 [Panonychus citri]XP_053206766.1 NADPH oxidase 5-like isoform X2 [Panonychus citri]